MPGCRMPPQMRASVKNRSMAEGSLAALREKYKEQDLEEIFVKVVAPHYKPEEAA